MKNRIRSASRFLPHALVACVATLFLAYALNVLTAVTLFRGLLAAFAIFVLFAVVSLIAGPPRRIAPPPVAPILYGTATAAINIGDIVAIEVATMHVKPAPVQQRTKEAVQ